MKFGGIPEIPVPKRSFACDTRVHALYFLVHVHCVCLPYSAESMENHAAHLMQTVAECGPINMLLPCWPSVTFCCRDVGRTVLQKIST